MAELLTVEFLRPFAAPGGAHFNAQERAGVSPAVAEDLVSRGVAQLVQKPKAPDSPPKDKMTKEAPKKKGIRFAL